MERYVYELCKKYASFCFFLFIVCIHTVCNGNFMLYAIEKILTAVSLTYALLFQGQQCNSIGAGKLTAVRMFSIGYSTILILDFKY
jgi:hypothetical protein